MRIAGKGENRQKMKFIVLYIFDSFVLRIISITFHKTCSHHNLYRITPQYPTKISYPSTALRTGLIYISISNFAALFTMSTSRIYGPQLDNASLSHPNEITFHYLMGQAENSIELAKGQGISVARRWSLVARKWEGE